MSGLIPWHAPYTGWWVLGGLLIAGLLMLLCGLRRRVVTPAAGRCPKCGYDTRFSPSNFCSECGQTHHAQLPISRRRWWLAATGLVVAVGLPVYVAQGRIREFGWQYYECVGPLYWLLPDVTMQSAAYGPYRLRVTRDRRAYVGKYGPQTATLIGPHGMVLEVRDDFANLGWASTDTSDPQNVSVPPFYDLDGDGVVEAVLQTCPGGNSGAACLNVVTLSDPPRVWGAVAEPKRGIHQLFDEIGELFDHFYRDKDGTLLGWEWDHSFVFFHTSHAGSAYGRRIVQFRNGRIEGALDRMREPLPDEHQLQLTAGDCRTTKVERYTANDQLEQLYGPLVGTMVDLIYAGHATAAYAFLDRAWAGSAGAKAAFISDFQARLSASPNLADLIAMGHPPLPAKKR